MDRRTFSLAALALALPGIFDPRRCAADDEDDRERARRRIGITRDQQRRIEALYEDADEEKREIRRRLGDLYRDLDQAYDYYDFDRGRVRNLIGQVGGLQRRILDLHLNNEERLRRILSREQFGRLRTHLRRERGKRNDDD